MRAIPFAAPPLGELRWRPPPPSSWQGERDATAFASRCPQQAGISGGPTLGNEYCPTMNNYANATLAGSKQTVMVKLHGGEENLDSAQDVRWNVVPPFWRHGVIAVTVQYRLGLLGFLAHPLLTAEPPQSSCGTCAPMDLIASGSAGPSGST